MRKSIFRPFLEIGLACLGVWLGVLSDAWAFPEMVRHGYVNCTTCHVSPSGGGLLNFYGRELSREVLSTWGQGEANSAESAFAYQKIRPPEWLLLGGDLRTVEVYQDTAAFRRARLLLMQADLEGAVVLGKWTFAAALGLPGEEKKISPQTADILSRKHYVLYQWSDEVSLRAGRFLYAYGINTPDHVIATKQGLRLGQPGLESYNVEAAYLGERWGAILTGILGRPDSPSLKRESGVAAQGSYSFLERYKIGFSFLHAGANGVGRDVLGPYGILGFSPHVFLLTELDFQSARSEWEVMTYHRLNYEFTQGMHAYLTHEVSGLDPERWESREQAYGLGIQFFPRAHLEVNLSWQFKKNYTLPDVDQYAWFLFHFYL